MNKARREQLNKIFSNIEEIVSRLETIRDEEQDAYDNLPESFQDSEKGQAAQQAIGYLEDALGELDSANGNINAAQD